MFYKIVINNIPTLYNMSKVKKVELVNNTINLYYKSSSIIGNILFLQGYTDEICETIKCNNPQDAEHYFDTIEKMLK